MRSLATVAEETHSLKLIRSSSRINLPMAPVVSIYIAPVRATIVKCPSRVGGGMEMTLVSPKGQGNCAALFRISSRAGAWLKKGLEAR